MSITATNTVGQYLLDRLHSLGAEHVFGVPGDYILRFDKLVEEHEIQLINTTRESTAGYMADSYSRLRGIGAACITYGVGINITNAIAQAYVESSPIVIISGAPGKEELERCHQLHHLFDGMTQAEVFQKITIDQAILDDPAKAVSEIDRVLDNCLRYKKPVYIEIPRDHVDSTIDIESYQPEPTPASDPETLTEALDEIEDLLKNCKSPLIWLGHEVHRYGLLQDVLRFAERYRIPIVSSLLGKSVISERHPLYVGLYQGGMSQREVREFAENCDCLIMIGVMLNDVNTGMFSENLEKNKRIIANSQTIRIKHHEYPQISFQDFTSALAERDLSLRFRIDYPAAIDSEKKTFAAETGVKITSERTFACIQSHLKPDHIIVSDIGDCLFGSSDLIVEQNCYLSNAYFASLGFGTPGAIGAQFAAPKQRVIGIVGDGAFQMTCTELSTAVRYEVDPVIIVLNNHGFATERPLIEGEYNDIQNWNYAQLPNLLGGGIGMKVTTEDELDHALRTALKNRGTFYLIEIDLEKLDFSPALCRFSELVKNAAKKEQ